MHNTCEKCNKSFTRSYSLLRHQLESCLMHFNNDAGDNNGGNAKRGRLDGAIASTSSAEGQSPLKF